MANHVRVVSMACATCNGEGYTRETDRPCQPCGGRGYILVSEPGVACPRCRGTGRASRQDAIEFGSEFCPVCRGTGWALVID
jgi:DnaJ-class molecular chaperone